MSAPTFNTRHSVSGKLQRLTADQISAFPDHLEVVADDAKPYESGLFKPGKVGEFKTPEPTPDAVADAQANYDAVLKDHAPQSKEAKEAKSALDAATEQAEANRAAAEKAAAKLGAPESGPAATAEGGK